MRGEHAGLDFIWRNRKRRDEDDAAARKDISFLWNQPSQTFTEPGCEDCGDEERLDRHSKEHSDFRLVFTALKFLLIWTIFLKFVINLFFIVLSAFYLFNLACFPLAARSEKRCLKRPSLRRACISTAPVCFYF